mgnify:CR=1 FL=1
MCCTFSIVHPFYHFYSTLPVLLFHHSKIELKLKEALADLKGYHVYSNSATKKGYSGVAIISKEEALNVTRDIGVVEHDDEGRVICAEFTDFYLVNVYVPNSGAGLKRLEYRATWDAAFKSYLTNFVIAYDSSLMLI